MSFITYDVEIYHKIKRATFNKDSARQIENLKVTIDDMEFAANDMYQGRMSRVLAHSSPGAAIQWRLLDETIVTITYEQLEAVLASAVSETMRIWLLEYQQE